jgi:hypothetical protein
VSVHADLSGADNDIAAVEQMSARARARHLHSFACRGAGFPNKSGKKPGNRASHPAKPLA